MTSSSARVEWPADKFYWAVLDSPHRATRRPGPLPPAFLSALADELPVELDSVHAVCAPLDTGGTRIMVCAVLRDALTALEPTTTALTPASLPAFIAGEVQPSYLNLLVGEFEPALLRRAKLRSRVGAMAAVLVCAVLLGVGLFRRAEHWETAALAARAQTTMRLAQHATKATPNTLAAEVALLRQQQESLGRVKPLADASLSLSALLGIWPTDVPAKPQTLSIGDGQATLSVSVENDAAPFLRALKPPAGWTMDDPRLNSSGGLTRLTIQFRETAAEARQRSGVRP